MDADAFFASCEQALNSSLRGRPVVTGKERGIVSAASYEARAMGVKRGMRLFEAKSACPGLVLLPSNYETYSLFSVRMFAILRRFSPEVEEYSIDEAFVDLTGLRRCLHSSYQGIALRAKDAVEREIGITVSVGLSLSKALAKVGSKYEKPDGFTAIPGREIHRYLADLPVGAVWGIGPNTSAYLGKLGIKTALDFARKEEGFVRRRLSKPYREIWHELNGRSVCPVVTGPRADYQSISKTKTFTPPSNDPGFIFAQLSRNLENACIKARRHKLAARRLTVLLKRQDFQTSGMELKMNRLTAYPMELFGALQEGFQKVHRGNTLYRATGVVLSGLLPIKNEQYCLFEDRARIEKMSRLYNAMDCLSRRFGKHTMRHGSSLSPKARHEGERGDIPWRKKELFKGENRRQRLGLPLLGRGA